MSARVTIRIPEWLDMICVWPVMEYRRRKYGYSFRRIYLGEGEWAMLDAKDYYNLNDYKWVISGNGSKFYAARFIKIAPGKTKIMRMHREIINPGPGLLVDHRNGDPLDNRRDNLRPATRSENMYNKPKIKSNTSSKYIGVSFSKDRNKWEVRIYCQKRKIWLGRFDSEIDAARAYDRAAIKYHADFARLNFSRDEYTNDIRPS